MPLVYRDIGDSKSGTRWDVMAGRLRIASINKDMLSITAGRQEVWSWTFHLDTAPEGFVKHGNADNLDKVCNEVEYNWQLWLTASGLNDPVRDINDNTWWTDRDVEDLTAMLKAGKSIDEAAAILCRSGTVDQVRHKAIKLGLISA